MKILVLNGGSSTLKATLREVSAANRQASQAQLWEAQAEWGREREVLQLVAEGRTNKEAAATLNISVTTVETHRTHILQKLDLHSIPELILYGEKLGEMMLNDKMDRAMKLALEPIPGITKST